MSTDTRIVPFEQRESEPETDLTEHWGYARCLGLRDLGNNVLASLDPSTVEGRKRLMPMVMGEALRGDALINTRIAVTDVLIMPAQGRDKETGETEQWVRTVLRLADGRTVAFGSKGILKSLFFYSVCGSRPPWNPPAEFILKSTPIGNQRWFTLEPAENAPVAQPTAKTA
jgi:hypothetical protein